FFAELRRQDRPEANGIVVTRPIFTNPAAGNFALPAGSEARGNAALKDVSLDHPAGAMARPRAQADGTLNRGALQDYGLIQVRDPERREARVRGGLKGTPRRAA